jgi:cell division protein FtsZ
MNESDAYMSTIRVVGIGGGGVNAVNRMVDAGVSGAEFIAMQTDVPHLVLSQAGVKLDLGRERVGGLGAGANPEVGREAAEDSAEEIEEILRGSDLVIVTAGEGGGTGTGGAPVVARIAKELGALVVAIVTTPFAHEGKKRMQHAEAGIEKLRSEVDVLIVIQNELIRKIPENKGGLMADLLPKVDQALMDNIQAVIEIITKVGEINIDFQDIATVLRGAGTAIVGIGQARGEDRAINASLQAISSPLQNSTMDGATGVIFNISGSRESLTLDEFSAASTLIEEAADMNVNKIDGFGYDDALGDEVRVIVIATGFPDSNRSQSSSNQAQNSALGRPTEEIPAPTDGFPHPAASAAAGEGPGFSSPSNSLPSTGELNKLYSDEANTSVSIPTTTGSTPAVSASQPFSSERIFSSTTNKPYSGSLSTISGQVRAVSSPGIPDSSSSFRAIDPDEDYTTAETSTYLPAVNVEDVEPEETIRDIPDFLDD